VSTPDRGTTREVETFREGYLSVRVYCVHNERTDRAYLDVVMYRLRGRGQGARWHRCDQLKPRDLRNMVGLLRKADSYVRSHPVAADVPLTEPEANEEHGRA
jgi:hypothetical protein